MSATRWPAQPPSVPGLPPRPVVMWAPYRYGVFSWLQSQDQQIAETMDFLRGEILKGVTDGSDAQPGQIGEFVWAEASVPIALDTVTEVCSIQLSPGDWDVYAELGFNGGTVTDFYNDLAPAADTPVPARGATEWQMVGGLGDGSTIPTATIRVLSASPSPVFLRGRIGNALSGTSFTMWGTVWARRVR